MNHPKISWLSFCLVIIFSAGKVKGQMVGTEAYTKGTSVEYGIDGNGGFEGVDTVVASPIPGMHFRSNTQYFGFVANPQLDAWATQDGDFFTPGTPENGWGYEIGTAGIKGNNNCNPVVEVPGAISSWSHVLNCYTTVWEGDATSGTDLHFKISYLLQETDLFYTTTVSVTNNTSTTIPELFYHRNLDPDNNITLSGSYTTTNSIVSQPGTGCNLAHVSATQSSPWLSYIGLAGVGSNFRVSYGGFSNRDASDLWNGFGFTQTVGSVNTADEAISLSYKIQNLAPGATETFNYVVILDNSAAANAINNLFYLNYPGSFTSPPSACTPYTDTARTCGDSVPVNVAGSIVGDFTWVWSPPTGLSDT
ncbi:MAG: hypothetical protein M3R27_15555, partial [Bacteroidota bacterium]|nr:hypothetical protein [Bacteroidota bacterium]